MRLGRASGVGLLCLHRFLPTRIESVEPPSLGTEGLRWLEQGDRVHVCAPRRDRQPREVPAGIASVARQRPWGAVGFVVTTIALGQAPAAVGSYGTLARPAREVEAGGNWSQQVTVRKNSFLLGQSVLSFPLPDAGTCAVRARGCSGRVCHSNKHLPHE